MITIKVKAHLNVCKSLVLKDVLELSLPAKSVVRDLAKELSLDTSEINILMVNGKIRSWDETLQDGDMVSLFPLIEGG